MRKSAVLTVMLYVLGAGLVFGMGQSVKADSGAKVQPTSTPELGYVEDPDPFPKSYVDQAKTEDERKKRLKEVLDKKPMSEERWAVAIDEQDKYEAAFNLMSMKHEKEDVEFMIDRFYKEKNKNNQGVFLDAMTLSPYKETVAAAFEKVSEEYPDLSLRALATMKLIQIGYEEEGWEESKRITEEMEKNNRLVRYFDPFTKIKSAAVKEEAKNYLIKIQEDNTNSDVVKAFAIVNLVKYYEYDFLKHYEFLKKVLVRKEIDQDTACFLIRQIDLMGYQDNKINELFETVKEVGNKHVVEFISEKMKKRRLYKSK